MASKPRLMLQFAAAIGIAAMLWTAAPALAAESAVTASDAPAATTKSAPSVIKRHASRRTRLAASRYHYHYDRQISPIRSNLDCSGVWCGRQFVLMIGIGF